MKVCIVQSVLPLYAIAFFNKIVDLYPEIELTLLADLQSRESLNQYQPMLCRFKVRHSARFAACRIHHHDCHS